MKAKTLNFIIASMFLLVLATGFSSAALIISDISYNNETAHDAGSFDLIFTLTNDDTTEAILLLDWSNSSINGVAGSTLDLSNAPSGIANDSSESVTIQVNFNSNEIGSIEGTIDVNEETSFDFSVAILESPELSLTSATLSGDTTTIIIKNEGNILLEDINLTSSNGNFEINFSNNLFNLAVGGEETITVGLVSESNDLVGTNTLTVTAKAEDGTSATGTITRGAGFCEGIPTLGSLEIKDIDFSNKGKLDMYFGDDDEWFLFEEIEVSVEVENDGNYDIADVEVIWGLYHKNSGEWVIEPEEEDSFNLDEGDSETLEFTIKLDNKLELDFEDLTSGKDYIFYVKAIGTIDDSDSSHDNEDTCASEDQEITITTEKNNILLDDVVFNAEALCGSELTITADVWNIGSKDQDDLIVSIYNADLGVLKEVKFDEINSFDKEELLTRIEIPEGIEPGVYDLLFEVIDEDNDVYEINDEKVAFELQVTVSGNCESKPTLEISANLREAKEGSETKIIVQITNLGDKTQSFDLDLSGYSSWVESYELSSDYLVVRGGETKEITITLNIKDDVAGIHEFEFLLTSENGIEAQPIEVEVLKSSGFLGITGFSIGGSTTATSLVILVLVLFIIVLVLLIVKKLRK